MSNVVEVESVEIEGQVLALGGWYEIKGAQVVAVADGRTFSVKTGHIIVDSHEMLLEELKRSVTVNRLFSAAMMGVFDPQRDYCTDFSDAAKEKIIGALPSCKDAEVVTASIVCIEVARRRVYLDHIEPSRVLVKYRLRDEGPIYEVNIVETEYRDKVTFKNIVRDKIAADAGNVVLLQGKGESFLSDSYTTLRLGK